MFKKLFPFSRRQNQQSLDHLARIGDLPWQRPRELHEVKDRELFDALWPRLDLVVDHSNRYALRCYHRDKETGQLWEEVDADIGHTNHRVLTPVETIPAEPLPQDI